MYIKTDIIVSFGKILRPLLTVYPVEKFVQVDGNGREIVLQWKFIVQLCTSVCFSKI